MSSGVQAQARRSERHAMRRDVTDAGVPHAARRRQHFFFSCRCFFYIARHACFADAADAMCAPRLLLVFRRLPSPIY